jgi:hypothetical protein
MATVTFTQQHSAEDVLREIAWAVLGQWREQEEIGIPDLTIG